MTAPSTIRPSSARATRWFVVLAAVATLAAACSPSGDLAARTSGTRGTSGGTSTGSSGSLRWSKCKETVAREAGLQCATLAVPLDPAKPKGKTIELALAPATATGSARQRIGSLLFNPGGPGASGIKTLAGQTTLVPDRLKKRFDLVSWDPRGVGNSTPVHCLSDKAKDAEIEGDLTPDTPEETQRALDDQTAFRTGCESRNPTMIGHMSTADVAADLDRIRAALGDDKLNYVGFSYGTSIGATYATLFPDKVRAMVLDGSVSPTADALDQSVEQAKGFEHTFQNFVAACDASPQCALSGGAAAKIEAVRQRLDQTPVEVTTSSGTRALGRDQFDIGLATGLYDTSLWGTLARAIATVDSGGGEQILSLMDLQVGRNADGTWSNDGDARTMVNCADQTERPTAQEALADAPQLQAASPTFGDSFSTSMLSCVDWPVTDNPTPTPAPKGAPTILVVGTVGDPATPYQWAQQMTAALGSAVLLTYEGDGHTAFLRGSDCVDEAVTNYLIDLKVPATGTSCPAVAGSTSFAGVREELVKEFVSAGLPEAVAGCIADGIIAKLGETELEQMLLSQDEEKQMSVLGPLINTLATSCMTGG